MLLNRPPQDWLNTGIALTEDSRCKFPFTKAPPANSMSSFPGPDLLDQNLKPPSYSPSMSSSTTTQSMMTLVPLVLEYLMSGLNSCDN